MIAHPFAPVYDAQSRVLILGSFPSVKSREDGFYYGHPQNRFWKVLAALFGENVPKDIPQKRAFLLRNHIALWDVAEKCEIEGSSDASIRAVSVNDLAPIFEGADIAHVFANGKTAFQLYQKYAFPQTERACVCLPSTSPANCAVSFEKLLKAWEKVRDGAIFTF